MWARMLAAVVLLAGPVVAQAGAGFAVGDRWYATPVTSIKERAFRTVTAQKYDFSCGAAAVATLLSYHYEHPVSEQQIFDFMYESGDQEKIGREGFSLLDMKRYLQSRGLRADGFRLSVERLAALGVPAIALITDKGYNHFVVIKGISSDEVLLGDPALGVRKISRSDFAANTNGIMLAVRDHADTGRRGFNLAADWRVKERAPVAAALGHSSLGTLTLLMPGGHDF